MAEGNPERKRQSRADLELGREHMTELRERLNFLLKMDETKNDLAIEIDSQLKKIEQALKVKDQHDADYEVFLAKLTEILLQGLDKFKRPEDRDRIRQIINEILQEMEKLAKARE